MVVWCLYCWCIWCGACSVGVSGWWSIARVGGGTVAVSVLIGSVMPVFYGGGGGGCGCGCVVLALLCQWYV